MEKSTRSQSCEGTESESKRPRLPRQRLIAICVISTLFVLGATGLAIALWQGLLHKNGARDGTIVRIVTPAGVTNKALTPRMYNDNISGQSYGTSTKDHSTVERIWGFDSGNILLGKSEPDINVYPHEPADFLLNQGDRGNITARYVDILAGSDEMCVSSVEVTRPGEEHGKYVWYGDIGALCGQLWGYSVETYPSDSDKPTDKCIWMGTYVKMNSTASYDGVRQMKINMRAYDREWFKESNEYLCGNTIFSNDTSGPIMDLPVYVSNSTKDMQSGDQATRRRSLPIGTPVHRPRSEAIANRLIITSRMGHSARELCLSPTSHSSDLVSTHEELFCDMHERLLHPICGSGSDEGVGRCFDLKKRAMMDRRGNQRRAPRRSNYLSVEEWA